MSKREREAQREAERETDRQSISNINKFMEKRKKKSVLANFETMKPYLCMPCGKKLIIVFC